MITIAVTLIIVALGLALVRWILFGPAQAGAEDYTGEQETGDRVAAITIPRSRGRPRNR